VDTLAGAAARSYITSMTRGVAVRDCGVQTPGRQGDLEAWRIRVAGRNAVEVSM
jgi:hypothetical protein